MKKGLLIILSVLLVLAVLTAVYFEQILDFLPIDQSGWSEENGQLSYRGEKGDPVTGWQEIEGVRYYFDPATAIMHTGWLELDGQKYRLDENGHLLTGWQNIDGQRYFLGTGGAMETGWQEENGNRYYLGESGTPVIGWQEIESILYYFDGTGISLSGWQDIDGQRYYLNADGSVYYGWLDTDAGRYYLNEEGIMATGWLQTGEGLFYLNADGTPASGWIEENGARFYIGEGGIPATGWQDIDGNRYYLNSDGSIRTGWLEEDGGTYYLKEDGTPAVGKLVIEDKTHYFTSTGAEIILVNPWNYLPEDYEVELQEHETGHKVAASCYDALMKMLADCEAAGLDPYLYSSYRTQSHQTMLFNNMVKKCDGNKTKAAKIVAIPGTSEHQLGFAVDITDSSYRKLDHKQENTDTQKWLMEHCWDYGFILRYPNEKSTITGIIYEPWHYRYVGLELAQELKELGLCLEEYLDMLTNDGTTCGGT